MKLRSALAALLVPAAAMAGPMMQRMHPQYATPAAPTPNAAPAGAFLNYYGGHVLDHVKVVPVYWTSAVASDVQSTMPQFYSAVTDSALYDMLAEYSTDVLDFAGNQGTNQALKRGTATQAYTITPSITSKSITDAQIQQELQAQISAGHLPAADGNTLYMVHYPAGYSISMPDGSGGTAKSCQQFCAYHGTIQHSPTNIYYGTIPSVTTDGCELGCGTGSGIANTESVASHELVEATTDADVGLAQNYAPPLGWYDPQGQDGEIGDICNGEQGTITAHNQSWTIQTEWSNTRNACAAGASSNDYALVLSPNSRDIAAGQSGTYTVVAKAISGSVGTVSLSVGNMPSGITATLDKSSIAVGGTATLTVSVASSATNGAQMLGVQGSAGGTVRYGNGHANVSGGQSGGGGGGGGGCPAGTIDLGGGICIPVGCSTSGNGTTWLAAFAVGAFVLLRRRK